MRIAKPYRVILYGLVAGALQALTIAGLYPFYGGMAILAVILFPIFNLVAGIPVDALDFWLRDRTEHQPESAVPPAKDRP